MFIIYTKWHRQVIRHLHGGAACISLLSCRQWGWSLLGASGGFHCIFLPVRCARIVVQGLTNSVFVRQGGQYAVNFNLEHTSFSLFAGISVLCLFVCYVLWCVSVSSLSFKCTGIYTCTINNIVEWKGEKIERRTERREVLCKIEVRMRRCRSIWWRLLTSVSGMSHHHELQRWSLSVKMEILVCYYRSVMGDWILWDNLSSSWNIAMMFGLYKRVMSKE